MLEIKRQIIHACGVFIVLLVAFFGKLSSLLIIIGIVVTLFIAEYRKNRMYYRNIFSIRFLDKIDDFIENQFRSHERPEEMPLNGVLTFLIGSLIVILLFPSIIAIAAIAVLAIADSVSTLIGKYYGKHRIKSKSMEGSLGFFITSFFILLFFIDPLSALIISVITTLVELLPIEDNITVPLAVAILISLA